MKTEIPMLCVLTSSPMLIVPEDILGGKTKGEIHNKIVWVREFKQNIWKSHGSFEEDPSMYNSSW